MFDIALPFRSKKFRAYTIVRFREDWEVWAVRTRVWTPRRYMEHWLSEADALLENKRKAGLFPTAVYADADGRAYPGERWCLLRVGNEVLAKPVEAVGGRANVRFPANPRLWWRTVDVSSFDPRRGSARTVVRSFSVSELSDWSVRQKHLLGVMDAIDSDRGLAPW